MSDELDGALRRVAAAIGPGVSDLCFAVYGAEHELVAPQHCVWDVSHEADGVVQCRGRTTALAVEWSFTPERGGYRVELAITGAASLGCAAINSLIVTYTPPIGTADALWVPNYGATIDSVGLRRARDLDATTRTDTMLRGAFRDSHSPGLFLGTLLPQRTPHLYTVDTDGAGLRFTCSTSFPESLGAQTTLRAETTWISATRPLGAALVAFAEHLPTLPPVAPATGWNSWDYYFFTVTHDDIIENMEAIRGDPALAQQLTYIVIDGGWEHRAGEWFANYKFPGGMDRAADAIRACGFVPGIWTTPLLVDAFSPLAMRSPEVLIHNQYGDPEPSREAGCFMLDPTHPGGAQFIRDVYTRLYRAGFRFFKIDYLNDFTRNHRFHDGNAGPYDALRRLFALIRASVTDESHILGCSLPAACGPGVADSGRIGIDIHNHWAHVEWVCDYLQLAFWQHERVWINDPDFLVVRGPETSRELRTNVLNPKANDPSPPRWRSGPDFTAAEAQTWASVVLLAGGNVFLSDRISQLNERGMELLRRALPSSSVTARPLDLCDGSRASLWLQELAHERRLTVINWGGLPVSQSVSVSAQGWVAPATVTELWSGTVLPVRDGTCELALEPHASHVLTWHVA